MGGLYPVYVHGLACLAARQGGPAVEQFAKILKFPGVVSNEPMNALARLGLARAYVLQGDVAKARAAYRDFLTLWKDADRDLPARIQAQSELDKLVGI